MINILKVLCALFIAFFGLLKVAVSIISYWAKWLDNKVDLLIDKL